VSTNPFGYSGEVWRLFNETPRAGAWTEAEALTASAATPANRHVLRLQVRMQDTRIGDARFQAYGCPTTIAVGAWLAGWVIGKPLEQLSSVTAAMIRSSLEIPEERIHCALLGEDVLKSLLGHGGRAPAERAVQSPGRSAKMA
jgi:NifU-like protein involved in Fe-S cluster formation